MYLLHSKNKIDRGEGAEGGEGGEGGERRGEGRGRRGYPPLESSKTKGFPFHINILLSSQGSRDNDDAPSLEAYMAFSSSKM